MKKDFQYVFLVIKKLLLKVIHLEKAKFNYLLGVKSIIEKNLL